MTIELIPAGLRLNWFTLANHRKATNFINFDGLAKATGFGNYLGIIVHQ
jgi:hypothetical protein